MKNETGKSARVIAAAKRKVAADDAVFLAGTGKIAGDFNALGAEAKAADAELATAVHALESANHTADTDTACIALDDDDMVIYANGEYFDR